MKRCPKCGETKLRSEFHKSRQKPDGLDVWCAFCRKIHAKPKPRKTDIKMSLTERLNLALNSLCVLRDSGCLPENAQTELENIIEKIIKGTK